MQINNRYYSEILADEQLVKFEPSKNYLFCLDYLTLLDIQEDRAAEFLQGQLTCDVREVDENSVRQGAMCNLKGRVLGLYDVIKWQGYHLVLPKDLLDATVTSLEKTSLLSRVTLKANTQYQVFGFKRGNPHDDFLDKLKNVYFYSLSDDLYILIISQQDSEQLKKLFFDNNQLLGAASWHRLQIDRLRVEIYPESRGLFLPHNIDLPKNGYVSFNKGCYKGQEIIARMHYKGKLKYSLQKIDIQMDSAPIIGETLSDREGKALGEIIDYMPMEDRLFRVLVSCCR